MEAVQIGFPACRISFHIEKFERHLLLADKRVLLSEVSFVDKPNVMSTIEQVDRLHGAVFA